MFALANPEPEISYDDAMASRPDIIFAQDEVTIPTRLTMCLDSLMSSVVHLMSVLPYQRRDRWLLHFDRTANQGTSSRHVVALAYDDAKLSYGRTILSPNRGSRLLVTVAPAVAKAAIESGVARKTITDWEEYKDELRGRSGIDNRLMRSRLRWPRRSPANCLCRGKSCQYAKGCSDCKE